MNQLACVAGIDPGATGGIAIINPDGIAMAWPCPKTEADLAQLFRECIQPASITFCLIERVHAIPAEYAKDAAGKPIYDAKGKPVRKSGVSSVAMMSFGRQVGVLIGLLLAHEIPFEEMDPKTWQKALGIPPRRRKPRKPKPFIQYPSEESKSEWKNRLKAKAQALFPGLDITLATADALLIAEVARRIRVGYRGRMTA